MCDKCEVTPYQAPCKCECKNLKTGYSIIYCIDCGHVIQRAKNGRAIENVNTG